MYFRHCLIYFYSFSSTEIKLKNMLRLKTIVQVYLIKLTECRFTSIGVKDAFFFLLNKIKIIFVCECGQVSKTECMFNSVWLIADRKFSC